MQTHMHMSKYIYQYQIHLPNTELFTLLFLLNTLTRFYDGQVYTQNVHITHKLFALGSTEIPGWKPQLFPAQRKSHWL